MKSQSKHHPARGLSLEGGGPGKGGPMPGQGLSKQETQKQKAPTKSGITGLAYLHSMGGMAPGGGGGTPPPGKGDPPDDKGDDGSGEEENEEDDTDEETVSVTSSSQVSASRVRPLKWNGGKENTKEGAGGPPEDPNEPLWRRKCWGWSYRTKGKQRSEGQDQTTWKGCGNGTYGTCWTKGIPGERWIIHHWGPIYFHWAGDTPCI